MWMLVDDLDGFSASCPRDVDRRRVGRAEREGKRPAARIGQRRAGNRDAQSKNDAHISALWRLFFELAKDGEEGWEAVGE
jgi:hypothetical protein